MIKYHRVYIGDNSPSFHEYIKQNNASYSIPSDIRYVPSEEQEYNERLNAPTKSIGITLDVFCRDDGYQDCLNYIIKNSNEIIFCTPIKWSKPYTRMLTNSWLEYINSVKPLKCLESGH